MSGPREQGLLAGFRVVDLTDEQGLFCGRLLADLGADVIKVERPGGDSSRNAGPFYHDKRDPERSLFWFAMNKNKRGVTLDLESAAGKARLRQLVARSDCLIESAPIGRMDDLGLGYSQLRPLNPALIYTSISPFGQDGPYSQFLGSDLVCMAMSGALHMTGDPDRPPLNFGHPQAYNNGCVEAASGVLMAYYRRLRTGLGQYVDAAVRDACVYIGTMGWLSWAVNRTMRQRAGNHYAITSRARGPQMIHPCKDGFVAYVIYGAHVGERSNAALARWVDSEGLAPKTLLERKWVELDLAKVSEADLEEIETSFRRFFLRHTKMELYLGSLERGIMLYPVQNAWDALNDPQLVARRHWEAVPHPELGVSLTYPGPVARMKNHPIAPARRAPLLGEHNEEVFAALEAPQSEGVPEQAQPAVSTGLADHALGGVKVVEFAWYLAGPGIGEFLGFYGATVVHVESTRRLDGHRLTPPFKDNVPGTNRSYTWAENNVTKLGVTLDLKHPKGRETALRLAQWADIVIENYTPGTKERLGLSFDELHEVNPDLIMLSTCNQGQTGPHAHHPGFGPTLTALSGFTLLCGWPDREPCPPAAPYTDYVSLRIATAALVAALCRRERTGEGEYIDISQYEASLDFQTPVWLDYTANGKLHDRHGNRSPNEAPHGLFPCAGDDRWCAIAVRTDEEWGRCCAAMGRPELASDPDFATVAARLSNVDAVERVVGAWTAPQRAEDVMAKLQAARVPAGVVLNPRDVEADPQLAHRHFLHTASHPELGTVPFKSYGFVLRDTPALVERSAPCLGEHNVEVYCGILGMSDEEFAELLAEGVFE